MLLLLVLVPARGIDPAPQGLAAEYFQNDTLTAPRALERVDRHPSTTTLTTAWRDAPPDVFSVRWTGVLVTLREGNYTLATRSDDGSRVVVDSRQVVDNGGRHGSQLATGSLHLGAGVHAITIDYAQSGGEFGFELLWARGDAPLEPLPFWALRATTDQRLARLLPGVALDLAIALLQWCLVAMMVAAAAVGTWLVGQRVRDLLARRTAWPLTGVIVLASRLLNLVGIAWGAPARWAVIELVPQFVTDAVSTALHRAGSIGPRPPIFMCSRCLKARSCCSMPSTG